MPDHAEIKSCAERHETAYAELIILYIALSQNVLHKKNGGQYPCRILPANNADTEVRILYSLNVLSIFI